MFFAHDREALRELADLWDPNVAPADNKAYVARAKELETELETAFLNKMAEEEKQKAS
jgi:CPA2 family monovalent cation:H+ antiporter-2